MYNRLAIITIVVTILVSISIFFIYSYQYQRQPTRDHITIGFTVALSGPGAPAGREQLRGYEICTDWINSQGGLYVRELGGRIPIRLKYYDDGSDPSKARSLYEKLITEDKVDLLWAPWGTSIGLAIVPVLDKYNIPVILNTHTISEEKIRQLGSKNIFVTFSDHESVGMAFALFIKKLVSDHPELKKIAILYAEADVTVGHARWSKKFIEDLGLGEIVFYESYPVTATDVRGLLLRIKERDPDILIAHTLAGDTLVVLSQIIEINLNPKVLILGGIGATTSAFYSRFDNRTKEGILTWSTWYPDMHPALREFFNIYYAKYGYTPINSQLGVVFLSCFIFKEAVEKAGSLDPNKIRDVLMREKFSTPFGEIWFENQIIASPLVVFLQYQGGLAKPVFMASGRYPNTRGVDAPFLVSYIYPKPPWP